MNELKYDEGAKCDECHKVVREAGIWPKNVPANLAECTKCREYIIVCHECTDKLRREGVLKRETVGFDRFTCKRCRD